MKLTDARITILMNSDGLSIEVYDWASGTPFLEIEMNQEQTCQALSRCSHTPCSAEVRGLDRVGLHEEIASLCFEVPAGFTQGDKKEAAIKALPAETPEGWTASEYFGSQDSFFERDGKQYANTTLRRWLPEPIPEGPRKSLGVTFPKAEPESKPKPKRQRSRR